MRRVGLGAAILAFELVAQAAPAPAPVNAIDAPAATGLLFGSAAPPATCSGDDAIPCLIAARYAADPKARELALGLYRDTGDVAGVGSDEVMDGGYRGQIHLVPALPIRDARPQLAWTVAALRSFDAFFAAQFPADARPPAYRWRDLGLRYVRSVGKRTPSAYAAHWTVTYNVAGSLLIDEDGVRDTLFHELFHVNDEAHGDWSATALAADYAAILDRCGPHRTIACLAPYAPGSTIVRGGTYYAFQPGNGESVHEYAAELAVRYFHEQREMQRAGHLASRAFKCGPPENGRAWAALVAEFFAGRDAVPPCPAMP